MSAEVVLQKTIYYAPQHMSDHFTLVLAWNIHAPTVRCFSYGSLCTVSSTAYVRTRLTFVSSMYMLLIASPVINICSTVAWCRPYPRWYFTIFYFQCFPLAGLRLRFFWYVFPQDRQLLGCFFGRWFLIIPCSFSFCSDLAARSGCSFSLQVCSLLATHLPLRQVFFWPAILTPRYPVSGTPLPLRHVFFWPAILTPRYPLSGTLLPLRRVFFWPAIWTPRYPVSGALLPLRHDFFWPAIWTPRSPFSGALLPLHHDFFWPAILTPRSPFSGTPGPSFRSLFWCPWSSFSTPSFFSHPTFPSRLLEWPARSLCRLAVRLRFLPLRFRRFFGGSALPPPSCLLPPSLHPLPGGSLFVPPCGSPAIFTAPRFLPLRGFYRSAVFTAPLSPVFWGLCSSAALMLAAPQSSPTSGRLALCAALRFACDFYRSAVFTAPRFLPLRGFYRSAVFTAPLSPVFWGLCSSAALMLPAPQSSPTSGRLALCAALRFACDFYRSAVFTAPQFLPLSGFYRSAFAVFLGALLFRRPHACCPPVFTHFRAARSLCRLAVRLRFLPLRGFYRSAVFTAPLSPGLCSSAALMLAAPQSSPSSGRTLWCRLVCSVSGGPPFLTLFLYRLLNRSRSVTTHLTGFPFVHFIHIRGPSIVSSFECRDTGTTCTTTSLMGPFGYRKLGNLTYHRLL